MARKATKEGWTFGSVRRFDVPACKIGDGEINLSIDDYDVPPSSMIVFTNAADEGATRKMKFFCKKNGLGWRYLEHNSFNVTGLYTDLLSLTDQDYIREWHWDKDATVMGTRSTIGPAKRITEKTVVTEIVLNGISIVDSEDVKEEDHKDRSKPRLHGDMTLDQIEERKAAELRKEQELWWGKMGMKPPKD